MPYPSAPQAFRQGARSALPLTSGIVPFGLITGVTAIGMGLSPTDAIGMTLLFYSGSAQMVVMQLMHGFQIVQQFHFVQIQTKMEFVIV